ncbi:hypothetical protein [Nonomuraea sp. NPDC050643]|uniref:hypothetical protein n=1 Tax=Nonomuraea sp. NPDC050643 TaxID=3155660 RepID=UPI0033D3547B
MSGEQRRFELSVPQILGSALAAVTSAVAASYLGVAGTVIGAAVVSVAGTVATAVYTHYLKETGERVKQHTLTGRAEPAPPEEGLLAVAAHATPGGQEATLVMPAVGEPRRGLSWVKLAAAAAIVFAVSMGGILAYQAVAQRTVHEQVTGTAPKKAVKEEGEDKRGEEDKAPVQRESDDGETPAYTPQTTREQTPTPTPTPTPTRTTKATPTPTPTPADEVRPSSEPPPAQEQPDVVDETPPAPTGQPELESVPPPD